jgi:inosine-uridine nucleoside N-ribohydrolase
MFHNLILSEEDAASVTLRLVATRAEREITYIALGPLTTFASAFRKDRKLMSERLGRVVCMGGALEAPGNTTPVAECESMSSVRREC